MEEGASVPVKSSVKWTIMNRFHRKDILYVRLRNGKTLAPIVGTVTRHQTSILNSPMADDGKVELYNDDSIAYTIEDSDFPLRGKLWTDRSTDKTAMGFTVADMDDLKNNNKTKFPDWHVNEVVHPIE